MGNGEWGMGNGEWGMGNKKCISRAPDTQYYDTHKKNRVS